MSGASTGSAAEEALSLNGSIGKLRQFFNRCMREHYQLCQLADVVRSQIERLQCDLNVSIASTHTGTRSFPLRFRLSVFDILMEFSVGSRAYFFMPKRFFSSTF